MKCASSALIAVVLLVELAFGLEGGRRVYNAEEFPYLVNIRKNNESLCMGIIFDVNHVVFPGDCSRKTTLDGFDTADVIPWVGRTKYEGHFVKTVTNPYKEQFPDMDIAIMKVNPPGIAVGLTNKNLGLPSLAPLSINDWSGTGRSDVVVVGSNGRVGSMSIVDGDYCMEQLGKFDDGLIGEWFQTMKMLLGKRMICAEMSNTTKKIGDIPPGRVCQNDLGAPLIDDDGTVVGILVQAFCQCHLPRLSLYLKVAESDAHNLKNDFDEPITNNQIEQKPAHLLLSDVESGLESVQLEDKLKVFGHLRGKSANKRYRRQDAPPASDVPPAAGASVLPAVDASGAPAAGNDTAGASPDGGNATAGGSNATAGAPGGGNATGAGTSNDVAGPGGNATGGSNATAGAGGNATGAVPSHFEGPEGNATAAGGGAQQVGINTTVEAINGTAKPDEPDVMPTESSGDHSDEVGDGTSEEQGSDGGNEGTAPPNEEQSGEAATQGDQSSDQSIDQSQEQTTEKAESQETGGDETTEAASGDEKSGELGGEGDGGATAENTDQDMEGNTEEEPESMETSEDFVETIPTTEIVVPESGDGSVVEGWGEKDISDVHGSGTIPPTTVEAKIQRPPGGGPGGAHHHPGGSEDIYGEQGQGGHEGPPRPNDDRPAEEDKPSKPAVRHAGALYSAVASLTALLLTVILTLDHTS